MDFFAIYPSETANRLPALVSELAAQASTFQV